MSGEERILLGRNENRRPRNLRALHEAKLAEKVLDSLFIAEKPEKLIGDKAYDSDKLDAYLLRKHGVEMIAPHRCSRTKPTTQDGR